MHVPCSFDVQRRCALGFCEDTIPRARFVGGARHVTRPNPILHEVHQEVDLHPLLQQKSALSEGRPTRPTNAQLETGSPKPSSAFGAEPTLHRKG